MFSRRSFIGAAAGLSAVLPAWAHTAAEGNSGLSTLSGDTFDLTVGRFPVTIGGRSGRAAGVNGVLPGPLLRMREGDHVTLRVRNTLHEDTSIHWHGFLLPFHMDGVPGVSFPGIKAGEAFTYHFPLKQSGTYWYHSHSGLQEQIGHYGPIIIDPKSADPVAYDREYILMLSDWSFMDPHRIFAMLKKDAHSFNFQQRTVGDFAADASRDGFGAAFADRAMWGHMRMSPRDIADVTGAAYTFLINGRSTADNWNGVFSPGERVRLRIINGSAMTIFNVRIPGLPMTVVAADGLNVQPVETDEFQIGVAETYDVVITPRDDHALAFVAETIDRSGQVVATLGPQPGMRAPVPALRAVPTLTMKDMGMDHSGHGDHAAMEHAGMGHAAMAHGEHVALPVTRAPLIRGPGVDNIAAAPVNRLDEPGTGLEKAPHRTLRYSQLRSLDPIPDQRAPGRELEIHLTGNMERFMWSFDGVKFSDVKQSFKLIEGERVRMTLINDTMMNHPIHLHGMYFDLVNGGGAHMPRKHTVMVKPGEKLSFDLTADAVGDWGFHCHLLYHMHAGMMQVVSVLPRGDAPDTSAQPAHDHAGHDPHDGRDSPASDRHDHGAGSSHAPSAGEAGAASAQGHGEHH